MDVSVNSVERCVLCLDQKRSPVRIQCGHSFCFDCLDVYKSCKKYPWARKCPICRDVFKETKRTHWLIYLLLSILFIVLCSSATVTIYAFIKSTENIYHY